MTRRSTAEPSHQNAEGHSDRAGCSKGELKVGDLRFVDCANLRGSHAVEQTRPGGRVPFSVIKCPELGGWNSAFRGWFAQPCAEVTICPRLSTFEPWGQFLPERTSAVRLLDRLVHHCHVVVTDADSYRMTQAPSPSGRWWPEDQLINPEERGRSTRLAYCGVTRRHSSKIATSSCPSSCSLSPGAVMP
jgi:hypothetical protein